jgi:3-phosphoshikimate 1-carboxyvinyltransferase
VSDRKIVQSGAMQGGSLRVPGDKSISHRAAMLSALAKGRSRISGFLRCEDCMNTLSAVGQLGAFIEDSGDDILITGIAGRFAQPEGPLDVGNSGTSIRLLAGLLAGQPFSVTMTGDASLCSRPMERVAVPLRLMGADVVPEGEHGCAPLRVSGGDLAGIAYTLPVASAQVKSCVLLAGLFARGVTRVVEPRKTRDHTERMLQAMGADLKVDGLDVILNGAGPALPELRAGEWSVPGDFSSAAFWMTAAAITGSEVVLENVGLNPRRTALLDVLRRMGCDIDVKDDPLTEWEPTGTVRVRGGRLRGTVVAGDEIPNLIDELPVVAVAGALAEGETIIADAGELRVKESDRISVVAEGLRRCGADVEERPDGMRIVGRPSVAGEAVVPTFRDHRIAMAFSVLALKAEAPVTIEEASCTGTSYPGFWTDLEMMAPGAVCR